MNQVPDELIGWYSELEPYQQRLIDERDELAHKLDKLGTFLLAVKDGKQILDTEEWRLLVIQEAYMEAYHRVLVERVRISCPPPVIQIT